MTTTQRLPASLTSARLRRRTAAAGAAIMAAAALATGGAATANAAGPNDLWPGDTVTYPTWFWSATKLCAYNYGPDNGNVGVSPLGNAYESFSVAPYSTRCISRWWYGNQIKVINIGSTIVQTRTS